MSNVGFKGISVLQTGNEIVFDAFLQTSAGALLGTGTTTVTIQEQQSDGSIKSYDFNDNTFKTTALTTPTLALTHRPSNNATVTTGYWTAALSTLTGFTIGAKYVVIVNNTGASPTDQARKFQYGSAEGDLVVVASGTGLASIQTDLQTIKTQSLTCAASVTILASMGTTSVSTAQTGDNFARLGAPTGASIAADIQTRLPTSGYTAPDNADILLIKAKTDNLPVSPAAVGSVMALTGDLTTAMKTSVTAAAQSGMIMPIPGTFVSGTVAGGYVTSMVITGTFDASETYHGCLWVINGTGVAATITGFTPGSGQGTFTFTGPAAFTDLPSASAPMGLLGAKG